MERTARCHCGSLRAIAAGGPEWVNVCHCASCQRRTGALFHCGAYFPAAMTRFEGTSSIYTRTADSGNEMSFHFCPRCGSTVYWRASRFPNHFGIAVGAFADPAFPAPSFSVWEESMHPWVRLATDMQHFAQGRIGPPLGTNEPFPPA